MSKTIKPRKLSRKYEPYAVPQYNAGAKRDDQTRYGHQLGFQVAACIAISTFSRLCSSSRRSS